MEFYLLELPLLGVEVFLSQVCPYRHHTRAECLQTILDGNPINHCFSLRDFGVTVDNNLKFYQHIICSVAKAEVIASNSEIYGLPMSHMSTVHLSALF